MSQLRTPRLMLRRLRRGDLSALRVLEADPVVMRTTGMRRVQSRAETERRLDRTVRQAPELEPLGVWGAFLADESARLTAWGMLLDTGLGAPELGYMVVRACWGRGFATEAAQALVAHAAAVGVDELLARTDLENVASARVLEKVGFVLDCEEPSGLRYRWRSSCSAS